MVAVGLRRASAATLGILLVVACSSGPHNPACNTDAQCSSGLTCVQNECVAAGQCPSTESSCVDNSTCASGFSCVSGCCTAATTCRSSNDCDATPTTPICNTSGACVACAKSTDCVAGYNCAPSGACLAGCTKDTNCATGQHCFTGANGSYCSTGCTADADCSGSSTASACNTTTHACVACVDAENDANGKNTHCAAATPACLNNACIACNSAQNTSSGGINKACPSASPVCTSSNACVACLAQFNGVSGNPACNSSTPICTAGNTCVQCVQSTDCTSNNVCVSGVCTAPGLTDLTPHAVTVSVNAVQVMTVTMSPAPTVNTDISLAITGGGTLDNGLATGTVTVTAGATSANFNYHAPASGGTATVVATLGSTSKSATITTSTASLTLVSVNVPSGASPVLAGQQITGITVKMNLAVTADTVVNLAATPGTVPASVTVPAGSDTSNAFSYTAPFPTAASPTPASDTITATYPGDGSTKTATVSITALVLSSISDITASAGGTATGTVTLNGNAAQAVTVNLTESDSVGTPSTPVTIAAGSSSATFNYTAGASAGTGHVVANAPALGAGTVQDTVTVNAVVACSNPLVISMQFGDGGYAGSPAALWNSDFVEIHNRDSVPHSLTGLSIQYGAATSTTSASGNIAITPPAALTNGMLPAGGYYLVATCVATGCSATSTGGAALPTPDQSSSNGINQSFSSGKVFLVNGTTALTFTSTGAPSNPSLVLDSISYGTANWPGSPNNAATGTNTPEARLDDGCTDTGNNAADFQNTVPVTPRSSSQDTPVFNVCTACGGTH